MAIFKKGDNWYIDYYVKGKRKRKKVSSSKKLAEQVLMDVHVKIAKEEYLGVYSDRKIVFEDFTKEYLDYSRANKEPSSYKRDCLSISTMKKTFEGHFLFEITPQMIEKYKAERLKSVSPATVNRELSCLKHMYTKAVEWKVVTASPLKGVKLFKEPPGRLRYLSAQDVEILLKACSNHLKPIVVMALNTGMRKSEILNLKWSQVDLKNRKLSVIKTKNNEVRVIPINETLSKELHILSKNVKSQFVFSDEFGTPFGDIKKGFAAALRRAKIEDFRFHDLRHTFGSHMVMSGVDLRTVQQIMGHKDIKMTMRYSHLSPEYVQDAISRLDSVWTLFGHQTKSENLKPRTTH
ncbi:MAG: site-specific integrase [Candidatus Schekmanbacteria bacterium]|nr:site-specific integrase [Candidatus Schekmanbacteria bacterium]